MFKTLKIFNCLGKKISVFEKNNRIIKQVMFYYCSLRAFWVSSTEGNLWIINLLFVKAKGKKYFCLETIVSILMFLKK